VARHDPLAPKARSASLGSGHGARRSSGPPPDRGKDSPGRHPPDPPPVRRGPQHGLAVKSRRKMASAARRARRRKNRCSGRVRSPPGRVVVGRGPTPDHGPDRQSRGAGVARAVWRGSPGTISTRVVVRRFMLGGSTANSSAAGAFDRRVAPLDRPRFVQSRLIMSPKRDRRRSVVSFHYRGEGTIWACHSKLDIGLSNPVWLKFLEEPGRDCSGWVQGGSSDVCVVVSGTPESARAGRRATRPGDGSRRWKADTFFFCFRCRRGRCRRRRRFRVAGRKVCVAPHSRETLGGVGTERNSGGRTAGQPDQVLRRALDAEGRAGAKEGREIGRRSTALWEVPPPPTRRFSRDGGDRPAGSRGARCTG